MGTLEILAALADCLIWALKVLGGAWCWLWLRVSSLWPWRLPGKWPGSCAMKTAGGKTPATNRKEKTGNEESGLCGCVPL